MTAEARAATDTIHVALAVYDPRGTYSRHAGVVMASIFENTRSPVCVHILHDETLSGDNREKFRHTAAGYGQQVHFADAAASVSEMGEDAARLTRIFSLGTLFRLAIPRLVPLPKVIYLDCDVVVNLDLSELWNLSMEGAPLAGVPDREMLRKMNKAFSRSSIAATWNGSRSQDGYVNAGVLVMDLDRIRREHDLVSEAAAWFPRYSHCAESPDQDFLNALFRGRIKIIPERFNRCSPYRGDPSRSILHASAPVKPWNGLQGFPVERLYWRYLFKSPWGGDAGELVESLIDTALRSPGTHRHTSQCYQKIASRLASDLSGPLRKIAGLLKLLALEGMKRCSKNTGSGGKAR